MSAESLSIESASTVRVAAWQVEVDHAAPFAERVERVADLVAAERGRSDLVVLPELWASGGFLFDRWEDEAQPLDGPYVAALSSAARASGAWLHGGSFVERAEDGRLFNTSVLLDETGEVRATYRKLHLFGFRDGESALLSAGDEVVTCVTPFGTLGLTTCFDLRFPELYRELVDRGVTMAVVPAAWPERRIAHWQVLARARAIEDQLVVVAVNTVGQQGRVQLGGASSVIDAWGEALAEASPDRSEVLRVEVDLAAVLRIREEFPVLAARRDA
jgi:predicted amidohydrolase